MRSSRPSPTGHPSRPTSWLRSRSEPTATRCSSASWPRLRSTTALVGDLPDSIEEIVAARIDRLSPGLRRLLRSAAVLGMVIDQPVFESVLQADGILKLTSFDDLRHLREFIVEVDGQRVQFRHHLTREAAYEGLPFRRRAALHAHTADAIERAAGGDPEDHADLLSLHSFHGGRYEAAWRYSRIAAERARSQYADVEAAECYERALESAKRLGRGAGLDIGPVSEALGDACFELGDLDRAERALRVALQQKGLAAADLARLRMKVALVHESTGRYSSALRWISMGRTLVAGEDGAADRLVAGQLTARYARVLHLQGRNREAVRWATRAMQDAERAGDDQTLAQALECLDWAEVALGRMAPEPRSTRSLAIYVESGDLCGQGRIHNSLGIRAYLHGPLAPGAGALPARGWRLPARGPGVERRHRRRKRRGGAGRPGTPRRGPRHARGRHAGVAERRCVVGGRVRPVPARAGGGAVGPLRGGVPSL